MIIDAVKLAVTPVTIGGARSPAGNPYPGCRLTYDGVQVMSLENESFSTNYKLALAKLAPALERKELVDRVEAKLLSVWSGFPSLAFVREVAECAVDEVRAYDEERRES